MSSMFKKKGGLAFKPKIPSTRPRSTPKQVETPIDTPQEAPAPPEIPEPQVQNEILQAESQPEVLPAPEAQSRTRRRSSAASSTKGLERTTRQAIANATTSDTSISVGLQNATPQPTQDALQPVQEEPATSSSQPTTEPSELTRTTRRARRASQLETAAPTPIPTPAEPTTTDAPPSQPITSIETLPSLAPKPLGRRRASAAAEEPSAGSEAAAARPAKRARKTQTATSVDGTTEAPRRRRKSSATNTADGEGTLKPRRGRSATPEDSEAQVVDLQKLKMSDLTKDLHIGKKFSRHDELRDRERRARAKSKSAKEEGATDSRSGTPVNGIQKTNSVERDPPAPAPAAAPASGPQFRIVDGQIVVDQSSLVMDRHARAAAAQAGQTMETIEENDFTRLITSSSYMNTSKLRGPNVWTEHDTELFYRGLSMLGTDFEMIAQMIPGKQRRHVKLKFNREERHNPQRINSALIGEKTIKIDMDEYQAATGAEFESVEVIEAEQRKIEETYEAERQRVVDEQAEIMRKKREELFADDDTTTVKKKKRGGKKEKIQYGLNGEPIGTE